MYANAAPLATATQQLGKRKLQLEEALLARHYHDMPRTMLRYGIETFPGARRQDWLYGRIDCAKL